jgi:hypothetical protein
MRGHMPVVKATPNITLTKGRQLALSMPSMVTITSMKFS